MIQNDTDTSLLLKKQKEPALEKRWIRKMTPSPPCRKPMQLCNITLRPRSKREFSINEIMKTGKHINRKSQGRNHRSWCRTIIGLFWSILHFPHPRFTSVKRGKQPDAMTLLGLIVGMNRMGTVHRLTRSLRICRKCHIRTAARNSGKSGACLSQGKGSDRKPIPAKNRTAAMVRTDRSWSRNASAGEIMAEMLCHPVSHIRRSCR